MLLLLCSYSVHSAENYYCWDWRWLIRTMTQDDIQQFLTLYERSRQLLHSSDASPSSPPLSSTSSTSVSSSSAAQLSVSSASAAASATSSAHIPRIIRLRVRREIEALLQRVQIQVEDNNNNSERLLWFFMLNDTCYDDHDCNNSRYCVIPVYIMVRRKTYFHHDYRFLLCHYCHHC